MIIRGFSATAEVQDVLNAANAGAVCRPALPSHRGDVVNVENAGAQSTKESIQRKGIPDAACFLHSVVFVGGCQKGLLFLWQRAASLPHPFGLFPTKTPVFGAAYGEIIHLLRNITD